MRMPQWLCRVNHSRPACRAPRLNSCRYVRPVVELLEDRTLLSGGTLDPSFGSSGSTLADFGMYNAGGDVALQSDGKIIEVGSSYLPSGVCLLRLNTDGSL